MASTRPSKKNETIEIRLSDEVKASFMAHCRQDGRTASEAIRLFIDAQIAPSADRPRRRIPHWRIVAAGVVGAALGIGAAAPSLAQSAPNDRAAFHQLDRNHDGVLSCDEFRAR
jgi:hypothetical protein